MYDELSKIKNIKLLTGPDSCMVSFVPVHMYMLDFGALVGARGVCLRVGNMCASWIHKKLKVDGSARISIGPWNTIDDAEYVISVIKDVVA
jgi:selenocysteine lyase/cysteine desulfurase